MIRDTFRKWTGKPPKSVNEIGIMQTRRLPIPGLEGQDKYVEFVAKRNKEGLWSITPYHNMKVVTAGLQEISNAFAATIKKHLGQERNDPSTLKMNFDNALLILREMEDSVYAHTGMGAGSAPRLHYSEAQALLPAQFVEGLDAVQAQRTKDFGPVFESTKPAPAPARRYQGPQPPN